MAKITVIYAGDYGNTEKMAHAAKEGAQNIEGTEVVIKQAEEVTSEDFESSDGVILGTPVHMGGPDWRVKKMIDTVCAGLWMQNRMNGKVVGVFASGGGFGNGGGGVELTFVSMLNNFAELGMIIVPLPKNTENYEKGGLQWGPYGRSADESMAHTGVSDEALEVVKRHAENVTKVAARLKDQEIFTRG